MAGCRPTSAALFSKGTTPKVRIHQHAPTQGSKANWLSYSAREIDWKWAGWINWARYLAFRHNCSTETISYYAPDAYQVTEKGPTQGNIICLNHYTVHGHYWRARFPALLQKSRKPERLVDLFYVRAYSFKPAYWGHEVCQKRYVTTQPRNINKLSEHSVSTWAASYGCPGG